MQLLRPDMWIEELGLTVGGTFALQLIEMEVDGLAEVSSISPCPEIIRGKGSVVTGRFVTHQVSNLMEVTLESGTRFTGTTTHPVWLPDHEMWVTIESLQEGDRVDTLDGPVAITSVTPLSTIANVYNLEVHGHHVYRITDDGVLVHNTGEGCFNAPVSRTTWGPEHGKGNTAHNNAIEDLLDDAQARGATDLRKNRVQRDVDGGRVLGPDGKYTRPDGSYIEDGVRQNYNRVSNLDDIDREIEAFMRMIKADPKAINSLEF